MALARVDAALSSIALSANATFDSNFQAQFGISSISAVTMIIVGTPSPTASSANLVPTIAAAAGGAGGGVLLIVGTMYVVVKVLGRRRRQRVANSFDVYRASVPASTPVAPQPHHTCDPF